MTIQAEANHEQNPKAFKKILKTDADYQRSDSANLHLRKVYRFEKGTRINFLETQKVLKWNW